MLVGPSPVTKNSPLNRFSLQISRGSAHLSAVSGDGVGTRQRAREHLRSMRKIR